MSIKDSGLLASVASQLVDGGGILASDESPPTLGKRLVKAGLENDEVSYYFLFYSSFSFLLSLPQSKTSPSTEKKTFQGNPLRLALVPLRRQPLRQRHPRVHRVRGGPRPESARNLPPKGGDRRRRGRRRRSRGLSPGAAGAAGRPRRRQGGRGARPLRGSRRAAGRHGHAGAREAPRGLRAVEGARGELHQVAERAGDPGEGGALGPLGQLLARPRPLLALLLWRLPRRRRRQRRAARALRGSVSGPRARAPDRAGAADRRGAPGRGRGGGPQGL